MTFNDYSYWELLKCKPFVSDSKQGVYPFLIPSDKLSSKLNMEGVLFMDEEKVMLWKQRLLSFRSSGLSATEWCKENHVAPPTFYYWKSRLEKENDDKQPSFVEVTPIEKML